MRACVVCMFIQRTCHSLALTQACMGCVTQPLQSQGDRSHGDTARIKLHEGFQLFYVLAERKHICHSSSLLRAAMCGVGTKACLAPVHAVEMDAITVKICSVNCRGGVDMESLAYSYTPVLSLPHDSFNFR